MVAPISRIEVISSSPIRREEIALDRQRGQSHLRTTCNRVMKYTVFVAFPLFLAGFVSYAAARSQDAMDRGSLIFTAGFCVSISVYFGYRLKRDDDR